MQHRFHKVLIVLVAALAGCVTTPTNTQTGGGGIAAFGDWPASANCPAPAGLDALRNGLLVLVNMERQAQGLGPVRADPRTGAAAQKHACDIATQGQLGHIGSDGSTLTTRLGREGVRGVAAIENAGLGYVTPAATMAGWLASPGHRTNLFNPRVTHFGAGVADTAKGQRVWVLVMAQ